MAAERTPAGIEARLRKLERMLRRQLATGRNLEQRAVEIGRLDYDPVDIYLRLRSAHELVRLRSCVKEPWTVRWIEQSVRAGETLYDIGANVGPYALIAACTSAGRVVAIEPATANYDALCENVRLNAVEDRVIPLPIALGARTELGRLSYYDLTVGAGFHALGGESRFDVEAVAHHPVLTYRLDDLVATFALPPPDHVKIDVDGTETDVLDGASATFENVRSAMIEMETGRVDGVIERMDALGFALTEQHRRTKNGEPVQTHSYGSFSRR